MSEPRRAVASFLADVGNQ
jgi:hypothetical protein